MTEYRPDNESYSQTCWYIPHDRCPRCSSRMATNGFLDWCANDDLCGYCRKSVNAPLDSQNDDPDELTLGVA